MKNKKPSGKAGEFIGKIIEIKIDRPAGSRHPEYGFLYEINYGFVPETLAPDGEEIDAYLIGEEKPVEKFTGKCVAVIRRKNDDDEKLVVVPLGMENISDEEIFRKTSFQEKFFESTVIRKNI